MTTQYLSKDNGEAVLTTTWSQSKLSTTNHINSLTSPVPVLIPKIMIIKSTLNKLNPNVKHKFILQMHLLA